MVEIKFGNDEFGERQKNDYAKIAGGEHKVKLLDADECDCGNSKDSNATEVSTAGAWAAAIAGTLYMFYLEGKLLNLAFLYLNQHQLGNFGQNYAF